jgi:hypothetical protein
MRIVLGLLLLLAACSPSPPATATNAETSPPLDCDARTTPQRFDRPCTAKALSDARQAVAKCGLRGHVKTTFAPTGRVEAVVVEPPDADARAASCVEARFREARVPPFIGESVSVGVVVP